MSLGICPHPEPLVDIGGETRFLLLHGHGNVAVQERWPPLCELEALEGVNFWILAMVVC